MKPSDMSRNARYRRSRKLANREPLTWACECGLLNLITSKECADCGGPIEDCWVESDRQWAMENIPAMAIYSNRKANA